MSTEALFDLVVTGHHSDKKVADLVQTLMKLIGQDSPQLEYKLSEALIFEQNSNTAIQAVPREIAEEYQKHFSALKVDSDIRPTIQVMTHNDYELTLAPKIYRCPACGHEQEKADDDDDACLECGVIGKKYEKTARITAIVEQERLRLQQEQENSIRDSLQQAALKEDEKLREEARQQMGIAPKHSVLKSIAAAVCVLSIGLLAFKYSAPLYSYLYSEQSDESNESTEKKPAGFTLNPAMMQQGKPSLTDQVIAHLDNGTLPEAAAPQVMTNLPLLVNAPQQNTAFKPAGHSSNPSSSTQAYNKSKQNYPTLSVPTRFVPIELKAPTAKEHFQEDQQYVAKLLKKKQYSLAHIFIETVKKPEQKARLYRDVIANKTLNNKRLKPEDESLKRLKALLANTASHADPTETALISNTLSNAYRCAGKLNDAKQELDRTMQSIEAFMMPEDRVKLLLKMAHEQAEFERPKESLRVLERVERNIAELGKRLQDTYLAKTAVSYLLLNEQQHAQMVIRRIKNTETKAQLQTLIHQS